LRLAAGLGYGPAAAADGITVVVQRESSLERWGESGAPRGRFGGRKLPYDEVRITIGYGRVIS